TYGMPDLLSKRRTTRSRLRRIALWMLLVLAAILACNPLPALADSIIATVPVGAFPKAVAVNATTNRLYVANYADSTVSVIDGSTNTVLGSPIPVGSAPGAIAVNATTNRLYVANSADSTVSVIDGSTNTVLGSPIPVGLVPFGIGVNPTTNRIYVANNGDRTV